MDVRVTPLQSFVHGRITAREGRVIVISEGIAQDLERAGLVRINPVPAPVKADAGKGADDGPGQPSSVSQAAQAFTMQTSKSLRRGATKTEGGAGSA